MKLRDYLTLHGMSNAAFADKVGLDKSTISRLCNGQWPERETADAIFVATKGEVTPEDFLEGFRLVKLDRRSR